VIFADHFGTIQRQAPRVFAVGAAVETINFDLRHSCWDDYKDGRHQTQAVDY